MLSIANISKKNFFGLISFLSAFLGLALFFIYKAFPGYSSVSQDLGKDFVFLFLVSLSVLSYLIFILQNKTISVIENKYVRYLFIILPVVILLSSLFSGEFRNAFLGKYTFLQSGLTYIAIVIAVYIVVIFLKKYKALAWFIFFISNLAITLPTIIALILSKFGFLNFSNKLVSFVDNWDTVALASGIIIVISLIYYEVIAKSKSQKIVSLSIIILHLLLIACIVIPDIWYALLISSVLVYILNKSAKPFYEKVSFYIGVVSLIFSIFYILVATNLGFANNLMTKYVNYSNKYSGVNYVFLKPRIGLSLELGLKQIKRGHFFGSGPNEFYKVWQKDKPQGVIDSNYWSNDFSNSYSALTTIFVTLGIFGLAILTILSVAIIKSFKEKFISYQQEENYKFNYEDKFYLFASFILFIFSLSIFLFFTNILNALILLSIAIAFSINILFSQRDSGKFKSNFVFLTVLLILLIVSSKSIFNKVKSSKIINSTLTTYNKDNNLDSLEKGILRASNIDKSDINDRLLSNFYSLKAQNILSQLSASSSQETITNLQSTAATAIDKSISFAKSAIGKDQKDYNNYLSLGSIYGLLMNASTQNKNTNYTLAKDAYTNAISLYPKNPTIYLALAQLEYDYNQDSTTTKNSLEQSLKIKPNYSDAFFTYSQLSLLNNDKDSALKYLLNAIQSDPNNINAYLQYGILLLNSGNITNEDLNKAFTAFMTVLQLDSNNLTAGYYLGVTYILAKEYDKASNVISILEKALPGDSKVLELSNFLKQSEEKTTSQTTSTNKK